MVPFLCCKGGSSTTDAVVDQEVSNKNRAVPSDGDSSGKMVGRYRGGDDDDDNDWNDNSDFNSTLFFSARQSFSQTINALPYPPRSSKVQLSKSRLSCARMEEPDSLLMPTSSTPEAVTERKTNSCKVIRNNLQRTPTVMLKERLASSDEIDGENENRSGYPGELSESEFEACLEFRRRLRGDGASDGEYDPTYRAMVYINVDFCLDDPSKNHDQKNNTVSSGTGPEEEAFALCRFLRARQFNVDDTFAMMDEHIDLFRECLVEHNLWRSVDKVTKHINCPLEVFWNSFPMAPHGIAKNGSFVVYMKAGNIRLEDGFDCINESSSPEDFVNQYLPMAWYVMCDKFCYVMDEIQQNQRRKHKQDDTKSTTTVLAEAVVIVDMSGLQRSFFTTRTMEFLKNCFGIIECFPEILNRVVVVNVPYFFSFIWTVLKHFVDPRTAKKIGFFSSVSAAKKDLLEVVESDQLLKEFGGDDETTYSDVLESQMIKDSRYRRFVIERYNTHDNRNKGRSKVSEEPLILQSFELTCDETAILSVYTQAKVHVDTSKKEEDVSTTGTRFLLVRSPIVTSNAGKMHINDTNMRYGQPAAVKRENSIVHGPGSIQLISSFQPEFGNDKEQYLVVVSIL